MILTIDPGKTLRQSRQLRLDLGLFILLVPYLLEDLLPLLSQVLNACAGRHGTGSGRMPWVTPRVRLLTLHYS